jgi:hypothetical protein
MPKRVPEMPPAADDSVATDSQLADLSALADDTLDPARRDEVRAWIAGSPELTATYERERRAVEILHRARTMDRAPLALRERLEAQRPTTRQRTRRRIEWGGALAAGLAVVALALVLLLPGGTPGSPSVSQAAALALRGSVGPAPMPDPNTQEAKLQDYVGDVYFPDWAQKFNWKAVGQRVDSINGHQAVTVYYRSGIHEVAYTIVSSPALEEPNAPATTWNNTELRTLHLGDRTVVTWRRGDQTCVLSSGTTVPVKTLQKLAAWSGAADAT